MSRKQDTGPAICLKTNICARAQDRTRCVDVQSDVQFVSSRSLPRNRNTFRDALKGNETQ